MTKAEILLQVKKAEEDAKSIVSKGKEANNTKIIQARNQGREILENAKRESIENAEQKISQAKEQIRVQKEDMIKKGLAEAEAVKTKASENIPTSTEFLIDQFERSIYAKS
ncbi:MAG: ATP synthase archaeal subunit H [Methanosarcinales archaeon]|nr:ATP synthase archaeal subunit H [Methanosarcinales archaeon]